MREFSSCSCLTALPGPAWVLLSKTVKPFRPTQYGVFDRCDRRDVLPSSSSRVYPMPMPNLLSSCGYKNTAHTNRRKVVTPDGPKEVLPSLPPSFPHPSDIEPQRIGFLASSLARSIGLGVSQSVRSLSSERTTERRSTKIIEVAGFGPFFDMSRTSALIWGQIRPA